MPKAIADQVIVITGASSGIGLATALEAARQGARVVLSARNQSDLEGAVEDIVRAGGDAISVVADVAQYAQVEELARRAVERYGRIDTWVNNAGVSAYVPFVEQSLEDARRIMDINFMGQVHGAKAALPHLEKTDGALVCVGSTLSDRGVPLQAMYCASKHAIKGWLDSLRVELMEAGSRVRVTLIKPSGMNTPLFNKAKTQLGVMPQPIPPVYEPELAAAAILHAAAGHERELFVGGAGKVLATAERVSPKLVDLQQRYRGFASQKSDWPKGRAAQPLSCARARWRRARRLHGCASAQRVPVDGAARRALVARRRCGARGWRAHPFASATPCAPRRDDCCRAGAGREGPFGDAGLGLGRRLGF